MKKDTREIHCYDYVNHPYEQVRDILRDDPLSVFRSATKSAVSRAKGVAAELHVDVGGIGVKADVKVSVKKVEEIAKEMSPPTTRLQLEWEAATTPAFFPVMKATFSVYPLTASETQLEFLGNYEPPFGVPGKAVNTVIGYRIAEASVRSFLGEVAAYLRKP